MRESSAETMTLGTDLMESVTKMDVTTIIGDKETKPTLDLEVNSKLTAPSR